MDDLEEVFEDSDSQDGGSESDKEEDDPVVN